MPQRQTLKGGCHQFQSRGVWIWGYLSDPSFSQVQTSSPSPQRSVSRFPPRLSCATSFLPFHPPAPTQPARTQRPGRRMKTRRRRRLSKEVVSEDRGEEEEEEEEEEEGGEGPPWWWRWMKRRCTPIQRWWTGWTERTRPAKTVRRAGRRFEERWTGFKRKHTNTPGCEIKLGIFDNIGFLLKFLSYRRKTWKKIHRGCTNCHMTLP